MPHSRTTPPRAAAALALAFAASLALAGCGSQSSTVTVSGRVSDNTIAISVPVLSAPRSATATVAATLGIGRATRVAAVDVALGDPVSAGTVVARLDDTALAAQVEQARASYRVSLARPGVIGARLDDLTKARTTIAQNRETITSTIAEITSTRAGLVTRLAAVRAQLQQLEALQAQLAQLPPGAPPPPGTPSPQQLAVSIAKLKAGIAKMEAGIAKIDAGLAKARAGLKKLDAASTKAATARTTLEGLQGVSSLAAEVSRVAVALAQQRRDLTVLRAPVDGIVTQVAQAGESLASGAPVVTIRPNTKAAVDLWVTPQQRARLLVGDAATVSLDSLPGERFAATVTFIGVRAFYPPSWFATTATHMTRAFPVTVTCTNPAVRLAPGTPADVRINP